MTIDRSGDDADRFRRLLDSILDRLRDGSPVDDLVGSDVDPDRLAPLARTHAAIESIAGHDERVDAVVTATIDSGESCSPLARPTSCSGSTCTRPARFDGVPGGLVIVVNGPSGAGKSTLMQALQRVATFPLVVLDEPEHIGTVQPGYLIWRDRAPALHRGYLAAIAALARAGNHVAVSAAGHTCDEFAHALGDVRVFTVGLTCDLDVLVDRERRTGRWAGIAAASLGVHDGWTYDVRFDTTNGPDPLHLARDVLARVTARRVQR